MEKKFEPTPEMKAKLEELKAKVEAHERIIHGITGDNFNPWSIWGTWG